ncbi:SPOSA6832_03827, partial [Sporobolomyces salmonicolor]
PGIGVNSYFRLAKIRLEPLTFDLALQVWDLDTLNLRARLTGHEGAVLALQVVRERDWLISASGDGTIRIWHTPSLSLFYLIQPPHDNIGDILSLAWVPLDQLEHGPHSSKRFGHSPKGKGRLYAGCQDTSIQWIDLPPAFHEEVFSTHGPSGSPLPQQIASESYFDGRSSSPPIHRPPNKFFDSLSQADKARARMQMGKHSASTGSLPTFGLGKSFDDLSGTPSKKEASNPPGQEHVTELQFAEDCIQPFAHFGYVYCLLVAKSADRTAVSRVLPFIPFYIRQLTIAGDEQVKLWEMAHDDLKEVATLQSNSDAVLALAARDNTVFVGHQGGVIKVRLRPYPSLEIVLTQGACCYFARSGTSTPSLAFATFTLTQCASPHPPFLPAVIHDILTLSVLGDHLYSGGADGTIHRWDKSFKLVHRWKAHHNIVLSSEISSSKGNHLLTGGNDASLKVWDIVDEDDSLGRGVQQHGFQGPVHLSHPSPRPAVVLTLGASTARRDVPYAIQTVADEAHREECRQGALYFKRVLRNLGADTALLPGAPNKNPIILATFRANAPFKPNRHEAPRRKRVLCYGHYDVVDATAPEKWQNKAPFEMHGKDGWVYGRGVSDNKGPMLAIAAAASELRAQQVLEVDFVMVIEGEEETGSAGFQDAIRKNRVRFPSNFSASTSNVTGAYVRVAQDLIGDIDVILVSNSYWLGEDVPCLTFGLRGVIHASITVSSERPDLHSGIWGGVTSEPLVDLVRLLASLTDADGRVRIPGFLNDVRRLEPAENRLYQEVVERCKDIHQQDKLNFHSDIADPLRSLITRSGLFLPRPLVGTNALPSRWRQPALSVHKVGVPGPADKTLIPNTATASVSIRIVPDQSLLDIVEKLKAHLNRSFASLRTHNKLSVRRHFRHFLSSRSLSQTMLMRRREVMVKQVDISHVSDWWLGDVHSPYFSALATCIESTWGLKPLFIREGGSIPSLPFLEREFGADAVHFPMGTSSDGAHLSDERIRILNLEIRHPPPPPPYFRTVAHCAVYLEPADNLYRETSLPILTTTCPTQRSSLLRRFPSAASRRSRSAVLNGREALMAAAAEEEDEEEEEEEEERDAEVTDVQAMDVWNRGEP